MLWFGTKLTLHVVSNAIGEVKATSWDGEDDEVMELWPDHSMLVYAMHEPDGDDVLCFVQILEDGGLDRYMVPASCARLVLGKNERDLLVETRFGNPDEWAELKILDDIEQATLFNVMLETMQVCATDERRVM